MELNYSSSSQLNHNIIDCQISHPLPLSTKIHFIMSDQQALSLLMTSPVTQDMLSHIVNVTLKVIQCKKSKSVYPSPPSSPNQNQKSKPLPSLMTFISRLVRYTNVYTGTLLTTLVYLERLRAKLPKNAEGLPCTLHRIFLACLILSSKFHNDSSPKNYHWAKYTDGLFKVEDVNLMERQLLSLMDWDLTVTNTDLIRSLKRFIDPIKADLRKTTKVRRHMIKQKSQQQLLSPSTPTSPTSTYNSLPSTASSTQLHSVLQLQKDQSHYRSFSSSSISSLSSCSSIDSSQEDDFSLSTDINPSYLYQPSTIQKDINSHMPPVVEQQDDFSHMLPSYLR